MGSVNICNWRKMTLVKVQKTRLWFIFAIIQLISFLTSVFHSNLFFFFKKGHMSIFNFPLSWLMSSVHVFCFTGAKYRARLLLAHLRLFLLFLTMHSTQSINALTKNWAALNSALIFQNVNGAQLALRKFERRSNEHHSLNFWLMKKWAALNSF